MDAIVLLTLVARVAFALWWPRSYQYNSLLVLPVETGPPGMVLWQSYSAAMIRLLGPSGCDLAHTE